MSRSLLNDRFRARILAPVRRLRQAIRLSPPLGLLFLTLLALLLALSTARADELPLREGPKWRFGHAMVELGQISQTDFAKYFSPAQGLVVEQFVDGWGEVHRRFTEAPPSEEEFTQAVEPILEGLNEADVPLTDASAWQFCDDSGTCVRDTWSGTITLQFAEKEGSVRLLSVRLDAWEDEGC